MFRRYELNKDFIAALQNSLLKIDKLVVYGCRIEGDFHENFLKFCGNIKELTVGLEFDNPTPGQVIRKEGENSWMLRKYPSLEKFELDSMETFKINQLCSFLERNPSIRVFSIEERFIWKSRMEFLESNIKLDQLKISSVYDEDVEKLCKLLNQLYDRGFYKRLTMNLRTIKVELVGHLATLRGFEEMYFNEFEDDCDFSGFVNLKKLQSSDFYDNSKHMCKLAASLINLQQLVLGMVKRNDILPFIERCVNLRKIEIHSFEDDINLKQLNDAREKLVGAQKVIIYVSDYSFLKTKWSIKNGDTNLSKVELRRSSFYFFY